MRLSFMEASRMVLWLLMLGPTLLLTTNVREPVTPALAAPVAQGNQIVIFKDSPVGEVAIDCSASPVSGVFDPV